nr:odorant binding protein 25 [Graphosoma rubrolineatum]
MYCLQLVFLVVMLTAQSVVSDTFEEIIAVCNKEVGFEGNINTLNYNDPSFPKEAKCSLACSFDKKNVFKPDGSIDKAKAKEMTEEVIHDEELKKKFFKAIDECELTAKANKCETAFEFIKCKRNKAGVH